MLSPSSVETAAWIKCAHYGEGCSFLPGKDFLPALPNSQHFQKHWSLIWGLWCLFSHFHAHQGHSYAPQVSVASRRANVNETNNQTALGPKRMKMDPGNGFRSTLTSLESKCHSEKERKHSPGGAFHSAGGCFCGVGGEEDAAQLP